MSIPGSKSSGSDKPTPDDLAGIPVCVEEDHGTLRLRGVAAPQANRAGSGTGEAPGAGNGERVPTAADLAGIPVCAEGPEDLTVRPRKPTTPRWKPKTQRGERE